MFLQQPGYARVEKGRQRAGNKCTMGSAYAEFSVALTVSGGWCDFAMKRSPRNSRFRGRNDRPKCLLLRRVCDGVLFHLAFNQPSAVSLIPEY